MMMTRFLLAFAAVLTAEREAAAQAPALRGEGHSQLDSRGSDGAPP